MVMGPVVVGDLGLRDNRVWNRQDVLIESFECNEPPVHLDDDPEMIFDLDPIPDPELPGEIQSDAREEVRETVLRGIPKQQREEPGGHGDRADIHLEYEVEECGNSCGPDPKAIA